MIDTRRNDWYFLTATTIGWVGALLIATWDFLVLQDAKYQIGVVSITGLGLFMAGVAVRIEARLILGRRFTHGLKIVEGHTLVKHGLYRRVRHPAYFGSILLDSGLPLLLNSIFGLLLMQLTSFGLLFRIRIEEDMLISESGDEYREYMKRTKKIIPFIY